jgi:glycosyltransferase involved in cell wall biosynthesis
MGLRVLHVIGGGDTGGAMSHLLALLTALRRAGCDVHLLCLGGGGLADAAESRGLSVTVLRMRGAHDPRMMGRLRRIVLGGTASLPGALGEPRLPWDIVHTHGMRANVPVRIVLTGLRERPCLLTTVHSDVRLDYEWPLVGRVYAGLDRASIGSVDLIICVSESLRTVLTDRGYPAGKLTTIRSGLESVDSVADAQANPPSEATLRRPRLGTTTRLVAVKDIDLMLQVASVLRHTRRDVELLIVGDGPERQRLEALAGKMGLVGTVRFAGRVDDVPAWLREMDVFLVTSVYEGGVSMSVLEAMAAGLPVVVTAAGGVEEAVVDGQTGYIVARGRDRGALATALAERAAALLDYPALRARMGAAGARRVRAEFTIEQTAAQTIRAYERCLAARGRF